MELNQFEHILLIGMPASGKTSLGRLLAEGRGLPFVDLDDLIELETAMSIEAYWKRNGEIAFRGIERNILFKALSLPKSIISTGGGCPIFMDNMFWINHAISIFLDCEISILLDRLESKSRPILDQSEKSRIIQIEELYAKRHSFFSRAKHTINASLPLDQILNNLMTQSFIHT
ncbi:MAG: shikimate kinase [Saprospiraceae bacterium]